MAFSRRLLLVGLLGSHAAGMTFLKPEKTKLPKRKAKALLATMVMPDDEVPVDLMLEHRMRMISGNMSTVEAAVIDNRPPWVDQESSQEFLLSRYRRSEGATGNVQVKTVNYTKMNALLGRFFGVTDLQLNKKLTNLARDLPANVSKLDAKAKAARLLGMLHFLELCQDAEPDIDMCIYTDPTTFVYRDNHTGVVELAARLFRREPNAVVLRPPDLCAYNLASNKGTCKLSNASMKSTGIYHGFMVINRERFEGFAPMKVEDVSLSSNFEDILEQGLTKGGVEGAVRNMRCGNTFAITPYDESLGKYACQHNPMSLPQHAKATMARRSNRNEMPAVGEFPADYARFEGAQDRAHAVKALIERFESGNFPEAKYPDSVTNKCLNMCPSRERISQGLVW